MQVETKHPDRWVQDPFVREFIAELDRPDKPRDIALLENHERQAVLDELERCQRDFAYLARNYFWISTKRGQDILFSLWESQELLLEEIYGQWRLGRSARIMILKSRQLGYSTLVEALIAWVTMFNPNTGALVVSVPSNIVKLFDKILVIVDHLPWWMKPYEATREYKQGIMFDNPDPEQRRTDPGLHSYIAVQTFSQMSGVGQGLTLRACHVSEYTDADPEDLRECIKGDLKEAIPEEPGTFLIMESTGKGAGTYAHTLWRENVELGEKAEFIPRFYPWFFEHSHVRTPPPRWQLTKDDVALRDRIKREWNQCDYCKRWIEAYRHGESTYGLTCIFCHQGKYSPFELSIEQSYWMHWRRINSQEDEASRKILLGEQASTAEDAWQTSGIQVFPMQCLEYVSRCVSPPLIYEGEKVYPAKGDLDITTGLFHGVKYLVRDSKGNIIGSQCWQESCTLDHQFDDHPLQIWEFPEKDEEYSCGVDVAEGLSGKSDYSVAWINRVGRGPNPDVQVAMYRRNDMDPITLARPINILGRWYNDALMSVEFNKYDSCANWLLFQLQYPNLFKFRHMDSVNQRASKYHWWTTPATKPRLWQSVVHAFKYQAYVVRSTEFLEEAKTFQKDSYEDRGGAAEFGLHDDCVMAGSIAYYCAHERDWDEGLSVIRLPNQRGEETTGRFRLVCQSCQHGADGTWMSDNPQGMRCPNPKCRSPLFKAEFVGIKHDPRPTIDDNEWGVDSENEESGTADVYYSRY